MTVWQVTHKRGDVETVYLVSAASSYLARYAVREVLETETDEDKYAVIPFVSEQPKKLYSLNLKTGEMS